MLFGVLSTPLESSQLPTLMLCFLWHYALLHHPLNASYACLAHSPNRARIVYVTEANFGRAYCSPLLVTHF